MEQAKQTIVQVVVLSLAFFSDVAGAQQRAANQNSEQQATRQAQAVGRAVYESIEQAQLLIDVQDYDAAIAMLVAIVEKGRLTEYEAANVYRYIGFCYHSAGDTGAAIQAYVEVIKIASVEEQLRKTTLYTLSQLHMLEEQYDAALGYIERWFDLEANPGPDAYILHGQILYQLGRHSEMITPIETALSVARARNLKVKEEWYALLSFAYFQEENYAKIRDINKLLLARWPKKRYWLYLANAYRELGNDAELSAAYSLAYQQGFLDQETELITLAQLYLLRDVPYKAGRLLEKEMQRGRIGKNVNNYRLLSQAWSLAQEDHLSIVPLKTAAELDDVGDLYIRLANVYLNQGEYESCVNSARTGIEKGDLKDPDYAWISIGMCLYNVGDYQAAIRAFRSAAETPRSAAVADQWIGIINLEIKRHEHILIAETRTNEQIRALAARRSDMAELRYNPVTSSQ